MLELHTHFTLVLQNILGLIVPCIVSVSDMLPKTDTLPKTDSLSKTDFLPDALMGVLDVADATAADAFNLLFTNSTFLATLTTLLMLQQYAPRTKNTFKKEYDYIIVGAGAAGAVIANRLSELPCVNVLLLEAGGPPSIFTEIPALARIFKRTNIDWRYLTTPQNYTGNGLVNRQVPIEAGRALGGGTVWNGMLYVRGNSKDYDDWAEMGAEGWGYDGVLPYFIKAENNQNEADVDKGFHGFKGPLSVEKPPYDSLEKTAWLQAAKELGYDIVDSNGKTQWGFYDMQATLRKGERCSAAKAYLVSAENRTNLDIVPHALVTKVLISNNRAVGVKFEHGGASHIVRAKREVIVSAGALNTPKLLMLSGVGPAEHLTSLGIRVKKDLPVGQGLQDHAAISMNYVAEKSIPFLLRLINPLSIVNYTTNRQGPLSCAGGVSSLAFFDKESDKPRVDPLYEFYMLEVVAPIYLAAFQQFRITEEAFNQVYGPYALKSTFTCYVNHIRPTSRGYVMLKSTDPHEMPIINPNYLKDKEDLDYIVKAMKICDEIVATKPFQDIGATPFTTKYPGCEKYKFQSDESYRCQAQSVVGSLGHPVSTARMGRTSDPETVVDSKLRVKGIRRLRVIDASIMPQITSGNTMTPSIMIGEKGADIVKEGIKCK